MELRLLRAMDPQVASHIRRERAEEAGRFGRMRILITLMASLAFVVNWVLTGSVSGPFLQVLLIIAFYWVWFQLLPRIDGEWKREDEQAELRFTKLLHKYVDTASLETLLQDFSERVAKLEGPSKAR